MKTFYDLPLVHEKDFSFSVDMEAKLQEYRAKKLAQKETEKKMHTFWRWFGFSTEQTDQQKVESDITRHNPSVPWTKLDYAIVFIKFLIILTGQGLAIHVGFGAVYFATSCFALIWLNLGQRRAGEMSAYSVFNRNCETIQGTFTAQQFESQIRHRR